MDALQTSYDDLWQQAMNTFSRGEVHTDPHLLERQNDRRLGLTILLRPAAEVVRRITQMLQRLRQDEPEQYYYRPNELHVTVLSLFTATEQFERHAANIPRYASVFQEVFAEIAPFSLDFRGITASSGAVMVQGFPHHDQLNAIRDRLRAALKTHGLGETLDTRYRLTTAHSTVMRFITQPQNLSSLVTRLMEFRNYDFGSTTCATLQWVKNDWYMSAEKVDVLHEYHLKN